MKRAFILTIEAAVVVAILSTSYAQYLLGDTQNTVAGWLESMSNFAENQQLAGLKEALAPHLTDMNERQMAYMQELTSDKERMRVFSASYCVGEDVNPYVYGDTLTVVCQHFLNSKLLYPAKKS